MTRSLRSFRHASKRFFQYFIDRTRYPRGTRMTLANALMGALLKSAVDAGVTLSHDAPARRLIKTDGRVSAVVVMT
jgi:hypothetical protein